MLESWNGRLVSDEYKSRAGIQGKRERIKEMEGERESMPTSARFLKL